MDGCTVAATMVYAAYRGLADALNAARLRGQATASTIDGMQDFGGGKGGDCLEERIRKARERVTKARSRATMP
jgi:hypothetical protein